MPGEPLRILQVMRAPIGGLFRHVTDLTGALAERGHQVGIIVDSEVSDARTEKKLRALEPVATLGIHRLPIPRLLGPGDIATPIRVRQLARSLGVKVLHGHGAKGGFIARLARAGSRDMVALYTPHGGVLHYPPSSAAGRIFRLLERGLLSQTDAMIFESAFAQQAFSRQILQPTCPQPVIHNGLAPAEFVQVPPGPDARDFVYIGELRELKGVRYLLDALAPLQRPDGVPASLIMAGDGPDRAAIEAQIAALGLSGRVTLAGVQPARKMFALGRCVVVPSLAESLPYVVLEAAAAGLPVIATQVGGIPEIFGATAPSLVPPADAAALRNRMEAALRNPAAAQQEAQVRLVHIEQKFSLSRMTDDIEALYRDVLRARARHR